MKELRIAWTNLRRTLRERTNLFFVFLFPMLLILILGLAFGGEFTPRVGLVNAAGPDAPLAAALSDRVSDTDGISVQSVEDRAELIAAVERGEFEAGVIIEAGYDEAVRSAGKGRVEYVIRPGPQGQQVGSILSGALDAEAGRLRAATFLRSESAITFDAALARVDAAVPALPKVAVTTATAGGSTAGGQVSTMASAQLLLFVFLTAMTSSIALIETRRLGVARRMMATPTSAGTIVRGEALGRLSVALIQSFSVMAGSALLFGVRWGDPLAAALLVLAFSLVSSAVGLLMGSWARTPETAIGFGLLLGLGLAALGGAMMPLELFSPTMRAVAHIAPHAWAVDGFTELIAHGGGVGDIARQLAVLFAAAAVLFAAAGWSLRRRLTG